MKNYKKIKINIKKWYAKQKKEVKAGAPFCASNGVRIDNPTKEQIAAELRRLDRAEAKKIAELDRIATAPAVRCISIRTDWVRNSTCGNNPHTVAAIFTDTDAARYFGRASGCGYDKYSAAVTQALNACDSVRRLIIENYNKLNKEMEHNGCYIYFDIIPSLATSGSGINAVKRVLTACGLTVRSEYNGKKEDFLEFSNLKK